MAMSISTGKKLSTIKWNDKATIEKVDQIIVTPDNRIFGKKEIDAAKIVYHSETFDYKAAAARNAPGAAPKARKEFIVKRDVPVYPDSLGMGERFLLLLQ